MPTYEDDPVISRNHNGNPAFDGGVYGESSLFNGVRGVTYAPGHGAVVGVQENQTDQAGPGVFGQSRGVGVWGQSQTWYGIFGHSESGFGAGGEGPVGVTGIGSTWIGVYGETRGSENGPSGVLGEGGAGGIGVKGHERGDGIAGVAGYSLSGRGPGVFGQGAPAGQFVGDVQVSGNLDVGGDVRLANADCAEEFELEDGAVEPGTVVVLSDHGRLLPSAGEYDTRVAGVVSGAGDYRPALTLDARESGAARVPVALMGKVFCLADAGHAPIAVGDMLTTSATPGHAMKACDPGRAFGAVIGKALAPLRGGRHLIPVLASLR